MLQAAPLYQIFKALFFDHKAITLDFSLKTLRRARPCISKFILKDPLTDYVVKMAAIECYLHHGTVTMNLATQLASLGSARALLREAGSDPSLRPADQRGHALDLSRNALIDEIQQLLEALNLDELQWSELTIGANLFLEYLVNCIRNDVISYQQFVSKSFNMLRLNLIERFNFLKNSPNLDLNEMAETEMELNNLFDRKMRTEFEKFRHFDQLNLEKIIPYFVKLAKSSIKECSLGVICNNDGSPFQSDKERNEFIVNSYAISIKSPKMSRINFPVVLMTF